MKHLIVVLALAGAGCTTYPSYGPIEYGAAYDSYGYGFSPYSGFIVYPGYGYGEGYRIHRHAEHHEDGHWRDHRAMTGGYGERRGYGHDVGGGRRHGEPSMNRHNEYPSGRGHLPSRTYRSSNAPGQSHARPGMTRHGRHHHDDRQR